MKIGIITYWKSKCNYGEQLQNLALQEYLKRLGHEPFLICYDYDNDTVYGSSPVFVRLIRALNPWPSAYTYIDGKMLKIWKAETEEETFDTPGKVVSAGKDHITVACGEGSLKITELQAEGKKRMSTHDFLLGYKLQPGITLG